MIDLKEIVKNHDALAEKHYQEINQWIALTLSFFIDCATFLTKSMDRRSFYQRMNDSHLHEQTKIALIQKITNLNYPGWDWANSIESHEFKNEFRDMAQLVINALKWVEENIEKIITGSPEDLLRYSQSFNSEFISKSENGLLTRIVEEIFPYKKFSSDQGYFKQWGGYKLTKSLNISACPYCNIEYTFTLTFNGNKLIRPDLDHYFSKKRHPLIALSFYNLIPCCNTCNSRLKSDIDMNLEQFLHPWIAGIEGKGRVEIHPRNVSTCSGLDSDFFIHISPDDGNQYAPQIMGNTLLFSLEKRYEAFSYEIQEMIKRYSLYNKHYSASVMKMFQEKGIQIDEESIEKFVYGGGRLLDRKNDQSLSLLKTSVLDYLKAIPPI